MTKKQKKKQYRPDLGDTKKETEQLQYLFEQLGIELSEGEAAAEAVRFTLITISAILLQENVMGWHEIKDKIIIKLLE